MIIVADNDTALRERLTALLAEHGFEAAGVALNDDTARTVEADDPVLVIAGTVLKKTADEFIRLGGMIADGVFAGRRLLLLADSFIPEKPGLRRKSTVELDCDAYCDKPVDTIQFIKTVNDLLRHSGQDSETVF